VEYLYKAVVGATWAKSVLSSSQSASPPWDFQTLYAALDAAWLQEQEEVEPRQFDGKMHGRSETTVDRQIPGLYFQGQGMYGRPKTPGSRSSAPSRSSIGNTSNNAPGKNGIDRFRKPRLCNNCQSPDHFIRDCDRPRNILRNVAQQIKNNPEQIRQILFEMFCKLKMPASLTKTKNSSHSLLKLRTAKNLDRKETMLTPTIFSVLILQTSERDPPVRDFTMQSNVRIFRRRHICHRYLTSTPQLTDAVIQRKRQNDSDVHIANDVGTNQQWRGPRKRMLVMFELDDVCSLQIPNVNVRGDRAFVDTGAQETVIGLPQAMAYCLFGGKKFKLQRSNNLYRFGVDEQDSLGSIAIHVSTPAAVITLNIDVVRANVPFLIGLDVLDANDLTADTVSNKLRCPKGGWETPHVRKIGNVYLELSYEGNILFSKSELTKMHRGFYHPSSENLLNLL
jgi:Zinc knuckle